MCERTRVSVCLCVCVRLVCAVFACTVIAPQQRQATVPQSIAHEHWVARSLWSHGAKQASGSEA
jgi:hypothetical protein